MWLRFSCPVEFVRNPYSPTRIYCHTTGYLASTQWGGGGGKKFRGRQRSREGRRREEDLIQTSKFHHPHTHTQCLRGARGFGQPRPCLNMNPPAQWKGLPASAPCRGSPCAETMVPPEYLAHGHTHTLS